MIWLFFFFQAHRRRQGPLRKLFRPTENGEGISPMNKTRSKSVALILGAFLLVFSLTGCGQKADTSTIKIGLLNELTGGNATFGNSAANGAKMAIKEVNAKGGLLGKQIVAVVADNKSEPSESANAMTKLASQDKVVAVTGVFFQFECDCSLQRRRSC